jgi:hypothetical protein
VYKILKKLEALKSTQTHETSTRKELHRFQNRTLNLTQTEFTHDEINLLNLGWNYAIGYNIKQLITETEQAIEELDAHLRHGYRIIAHEKLKEILNNQKHNSLHKQQLQTLKQIKHKLELNNLTLVQDTLRQKIQDFVADNHFTELNLDPTDKLKKKKKTLRKSLNQCDHIIHKNSIRTLMLHHPRAPKLQVRIKTHKDQYPIRPVVNNINAPSCRTAKLLKRKLTDVLQLPNTYNTPNSTQLAHDITTLKLNAQHRCRCITFDIRNLLTNIPITETIRITKCLLKENKAMEDTITQYENILRTVLTQNYFTYNDKYYTCKKQ